MAILGDSMSRAEDGARPTEKTLVLRQETHPKGILESRKTPNRA